MRRRLIDHVFMLAVAGLLLAGTGASADDDDHEFARRALQEGRVRPLTEIVGAVQSQVPGEVIEVELEVENGILVYDLKILTPGGRLQEVEVDAATGKVLKIEDDD